MTLSSDDGEVEICTKEQTCIHTVIKKIDHASNLFE